MTKKNPKYLLAIANTIGHGVWQLEQLEINCKEIDMKTQLVSVDFRFYGCDSLQLNDINFVRSLTLEFIRISGMKVLHSYFHEFEPQGATGGILGILGIVYLEESHVLIHSWPEDSFAYIHVAACHPKNLAAAITYLKDTLCHKICIEKTPIGEEFIGRVSP